MSIPILTINAIKMLNIRATFCGTVLVLAKLRGVERHRHQQTTDETRAGQCDDPAGEDESDLAPVHSTNVKVHQRHTNDSPGQTLGGTDGEAETAGQEHGNRGAKFHGES